jgi:CRISPR-associated protein Cmr5
MARKKKHKSVYARPRQEHPMPQPAPANTAPPSPAVPAAAPAHTQSAAQKRAAHALAKVQELQSGGKDVYGNYVSFASALPAAIVMCGLGQALASEFERGNRKESDTQKGHKLLADHLADWLLRGWTHSPYHGQANILKAIFDAGSISTEANYIAAQAEALLYLDWLKKFAGALLEKGTEE